MLNLQCQNYLISNVKPCRWIENGPDLPENTCTAHFGVQKRSEDALNYWKDLDYNLLRTYVRA